jgi:two-component system chemotaxis response regulator CheB
MKKITVLIVDDSASMRQMLCEMLSHEPDIEVLDTAADPYAAREKIKRLNPDVLTLDVEMPRMDGLSFLEKIMTLRPMPVVMVSTLTGKGTETAIAALQMGAVECLSKPVAHTTEELQSFSRELGTKVRTAATARIHARSDRKPRRTLSHASLRLAPHAPRLIAIGASTGGVEALTEVLPALPEQCPPIVVAQHMPPVFTQSFANRLSAISAVEVMEATEGMPCRSGLVVIAPGGRHLEILRRGSQFICKVNNDQPYNNYKPSVDVLFHSVVNHVGADALGIIMTGMGRDGAEGLLKMRQAGADTLGQDESSCVVYGMPHVAEKIGAVGELVSLTHVADAIIKRCFL